ncbi:MAG: DUF4349 domain-containing protein [Spirochaetales bacterium]|nr:DUF4349 domain-containing protein [Spirochaetales bacterium]MCF7939654.1 DUF4349 domain-containing protein [Spirochaetales bacterium]
MGIESRIRSREEILQRNMEHLERAGVSGTLAIERVLARLLGEIERLKGRLRRIRQDLRFARVEVDLNSPSRRPPDQMPTSFPWLGEVDMYGLLEETAEVVK